MASYLFLAQGFEEIEALATVDILRRADIDVKTVSITSDHNVTGSKGICVKADLTFKEADFGGSDWLILPGGMPGATNLVNFGALTDLLKVHATKGRIAAICASPAVVLASLGLLEGRRATAYPGFEDQLRAGGAVHVDQRVVTDGNIVTANGPGSTIPFALRIVALTQGNQTAEAVAAGLLA